MLVATGDQHTILSHFLPNAQQYRYDMLFSVSFPLTSPDEIDAELLGWLKDAYTLG